MPKENKYMRRPLPCHPYDVEGIESWLTTMAQNGYQLAKVPVRFGFLTFRKDEPKDISYRLEASPQGEGTWGDGGTPEEQALELSEKYGWEFVIKCGAFYIYRSPKPHTRELNTDPEVQALSLKILIKNKIKCLIPVIIWLIFIAASFSQKGILSLIESPSLSWIISVILIILILISTVTEIIRIKKLQNTLHQNGTLNHSKKVKNHGLINVINKCMPIFLIVLIVIMVLYMFFPMKNTTENDGNNLPFATLEDLFAAENSEHDYKITDAVFTDQGRWRSMFSPTNIYWHEQAEATDTDGNKLSGTLTVNYHETISEALARKTAEDYCRYNKRKDDIQEIELSDINADYVKAYKRSSGYITVIIQKENKAAEISFILSAKGNENYANKIVQIFAESLEV